MLQNDKEALAAGAKLTSVWGAVGVSTWADAASMAAAFASFAAAVLSVLYIGEFVWKKIIRPIGYKLGWWPRPKRRETDFGELGD